jgi:hypothetical protein
LTKGSTLPLEVCEGDLNEKKLLKRSMGISLKTVRFLVKVHQDYKKYGDSQKFGKTWKKT